ncbi:hypothetical protein D3C78_1367760 [compost metagenome]
MTAEPTGRHIQEYLPINLPQINGSRHAIKQLQRLIRLQRHTRRTRKVIGGT